MPEGENNTEETFEIIMDENFAKLMLDTEPQIQEAYGTTRIINTQIIYS